MFERPSRLVALVSTVMLGSCAEAPAPHLAEQRGDTLVVQVNGDARYPRRIAQIDLKVGELDGDPDLAFGRLEELAILPSGGFIVHDNHYMRVASFDSTGAFQRNIGDRGQGPGQFDGVIGLGTSMDGSIYIRSADGRLLRFGKDGVYQDEWRPSFRMSSGALFGSMRDSTLAVRIVEVPGSPTVPWTPGFVVVDPSSWEVVDSTGPVVSPWRGEVTRGQSSLASRPFSVWSPAGFHVSGVTGRFAFQVHWRDGRLTRVERDVAPVPFLDAEWRDWESHNEFLRRRAGDAGRYPRTPPTKPPIRGVFLPENGEVWVHRSAPSIGPDPGHVEMVAGLRTTPEWLEPLVMDVFSAEGEYLAEIVGPPGIDVRAVSGGYIWGYMNGEYGEQYLVRLRVDEE